jgi:ribosomal-protein-alanine N-acetyltransferase
MTAAEVFPAVTLSTARLVLRPYTRDDAAGVHALWNDEDYLRFAPVGLPLAGADHARAVEWCTATVEERRRAGEGLALAAAARDGGRLVGGVTLFATNWAARTTEIHYWTGPWARGHGYAAEAAAAVARWVLADRGFARVALLADTGNHASRRVADAAGFRFEGVLRNATRNGLGQRDLAAYSLIPADLDGTAMIRS